MSDQTAYPPEFMDLLKSVTAKRPRTVITHLLQHGTITTQELNDVYGYEHAPRAIRDVKECGIPIVKKMISVNGRRMAQYRFGDPADALKVTKRTGRQQFTQEMKDQLIAQYGAIDNLYLEEAAPEELQIDHRIPYEVAGDGEDFGDLSQYQLLTNSANRLKSHACENCPNWDTKDASVCTECFWAFPEDYSHVACRPERLIILRLDNDEDIGSWDAVREKYGEAKARSILVDCMRRL